MGSGSGRLAPVTGPAKDNATEASVPRLIGPRDHALLFATASKTVFPHPSTDMDHERDQADRAISTGKLNALPRLHTRPINVVVFHGSQGSSRFKVGFPLRCLQRLSRPYIATLHCGWRHNSSTRGTSIPVLSY